MENLELRKSVIEQLSEMDAANLVEIYNTYCNLINDNDSEIYYNDKDNITMLTGDCPYNALQRAFYGDYNPNHEYVTLDGYGNLESFNDPNDHISINDMLDTIIESIEEFEGLLDY